MVDTQPIRCGPLILFLAPRPEFFAGNLLMSDSGLVRVDELSANATWEHQDEDTCLVIQFDPLKMTDEQVGVLKRVRGKSEVVAIKLPSFKKPARGRIIGFDKKAHTLFVSFTEAG
jgi:hypothetical protein